MNHNPADDLFYLGVKVILINPDNQILLLKVQKPDESFWELPGGRVQKGESEVQALHREIFEEAGIQNIKHLQPIAFMRSFYRCKISTNQEVGLIFSFFKATVDSSHVTLSVDHVDSTWVSLQEAEKLVEGCYGSCLSELIEQN